MNNNFSLAADRNKEPIFNILKDVIKDEPCSILEIGSGTGQHALYFTGKLPHANWHCSDLPDLIDALNGQLHASKAKIKSILGYEAGNTEFPEIDIDYVYTANSLHIMTDDM